VLRQVYAQLSRQRVVLEASLLKPNMVLPGTESECVTGDAQIASATVAVLRRAVPAAVPGILFLSGGQSDEQATARLDAINRQGPQPWELTFSFGRALQAPVLRAWAGEDGHRSAAQSALIKRVRLNGAARYGRYTAELERSMPATTATTARH
jgi:fructose-bisphosphate aldolase, class I